MAVAKKAAARSGSRKRTTKASTAKKAPRQRSVTTAKPRSKGKVAKEKLFKPKAKPTITDTFHKQDRNPFSFPKKVTLSLIPAISQLPINPDTLTAGLARVGGGAFVAVGGISALYFLFVASQSVAPQQSLALLASSLLREQNVAAASINPLFTSHLLLLFFASIGVILIGIIVFLLGHYFRHE